MYSYTQRVTSEDHISFGQLSLTTQSEGWRLAMKRDKDLNESRGAGGDDSERTR